MLPKKLKFGDTIGIISPASGEEEAIIKQKINILKNFGFKIKEGKHLYHRYGYLAGQDYQRAKDLMDMFLDKDVDAIFCFRGGYGSMRILPFIDWNLIKENPKIFLGFSDITVLLNYIYKHLDIITFHGPMVNSDLIEEYTLNSLLQNLMFGNGCYDISNPDDIACYSNFSAYCEGILVGGNLSLICSTLGTPYEIDFKDKILFIEDVDEAPYAIDRMLTQLALSNKLNQCKGFILGQFKGCTSKDSENSLTLDDIFKEKILCYNKPTLMNFMCGHDIPKLTLPIGAKIALDTLNNKINVLDAVVK